ncbi:MAG TPA: serine/threonine-protein kinase [Steroidobacteraceae bacterium]|nr:serine/threonine-protein kinase [Steroidobacteraceae bacterium]
MMGSTTTDRVQEAVAAFEAGKKSLAALEGFIGALLRSEMVSPADARAALRNVVASGAVPAESLRRMRLGDVPDQGPAEEVRKSTASNFTASGVPVGRAAETTFRQWPVTSQPQAAPDRSKTGSSWVEPEVRPTVDEVSVGTLLGGRYLLERVLGEGGMGVVYLASDQQVKGESFAIKVLKPEIRRYPEALDMLREEVRRTRALGHPNIVGVYSLNSDPSSVYMIMEYLEGKTLSSLIDEAFGRGMPFMRAWPLIDDMCAALAYAHDQSVIHSDIKSSNVFITTGGKAKLLDFGIARAARGRRQRANTAGLGALTPTYASCEMLEGQNPDARDDIYSLACVIYEMLSGKHPFSDHTAVEARDERRNLAPIESLSRKQNEALARALAFNRDERTASVESLLAGLSPDAASDAHGKERAEPSRKRTLLIVGGALAMVVVAIGAFFVWSRQSTPSAKEKTAAVQAQTAVSQSMLRIETSRRKIEDRLRDARSSVERLTDRVNLARNNTEHDALNKQLTEATAGADAAQTVNDIAEKSIFSVERLAALREGQRSGEVALQAGRFDEAGKSLGEVRRAADDVIAAADALPLAVADQRAVDALLERARATIESSHGDADAALANASAAKDQAAQALAAGDGVGARRQFAAATASVNQDVQAFLDRVIATWGSIAQKKMDENDLDVAQAAIAQAEALQKLKREYQ